jgi:predicted RNA-binding protein Jag
VKDAVYSGATVQEALKAASASLALPAGTFRYVVLDPGVAGGPGAGGTPARIAVLLDGPAPPAPSNPADEDLGDLDEDFDPRSAVRSIVRAIAEAAGIDVSAEIEDSGSTFKVRLLGPDTDFFLGREGAVLRALEQLLQRMYGYDVEPQRILVDCAGYRVTSARPGNRREPAAAVRKDGAPNHQTDELLRTPDHPRRLDRGSRNPHLQRGEGEPSRTIAPPGTRVGTNPDHPMPPRVATTERR